MGFMEHVVELKKRLVVVAVFFAVAFVFGMFVAKPLIVYFEHAPTAQPFTLNAFRVTDPMFIYLEFALIVAIVLTAPLFLYELWAFISPGLYEHERRITLAYIPITVLLFFAGVAFSYFVLFPYVIHFMIELSKDMDIQQTIGIHQYFTFLLQITIPFGFVFQLPMLAMFLTRLGVINPRFLRKIRKYAYFVLLVVAGLITPPDVVSQLIVMAPLVVLYEISIVVSGFAYRKAVKAQKMAYHE
jgi:sec-independent protein translocase protein TatC